MSASSYRQVTTYSDKQKFFINLDALLSVQTVIKGEEQFTILTFSEDFKSNVIVCESEKEILGLP